eukprot:CAMPEP_0201644248 /NCGR_PEP_ID=MMETSP0493-20130528/29832_1 /ASSEMBLY_ACC=CAM_ASM_000838 /TAXON_ID=420259 /ORGANISM="Thalassiosira gravida, Strain GMp14c1" /LENGTH=39 /DNA_ID= /DNA_START= /DNA_END= /DNA_ORIENTATION=
MAINPPVTIVILDAISARCASPAPNAFPTLTLPATDAPR